MPEIREIKVISESNNNGQNLMPLFSDNKKETIPVSDIKVGFWYEIDVDLEKIISELHKVDVYIDNSANASQPYGFEFYANNIKIAERLALGTGGSVWAKDSVTTVSINNDKRLVNTNKLKIRIKHGDGISYKLMLPHMTFTGVADVNKFLILSDSDNISINGGGILPVNAIPNMTSNTTPSGEVKASSNHTSFPPWGAFDDNIGAGGWMTSNTKVAWLQYSFPSSKAIGRYVIEGAGAVDYGIRDWTFEGSNDEQSWSVLDRRSGITWTTRERKTFNMLNADSYRHYRLNVTDNNGNSSIFILKLEMYERDASVIKYLPSQSEQNFINHGMDKSTDLDMSTEITKKEIINEDGTSNTITIEPTPLRELLGNNISILEYTDNPSQETSAITLETESFSVDDYIGELPVAIAYTVSTEDIIVSTTTEPFDIYDEFGDTVDVLYYTDDETVTNADLILEANWSPIDELEGDFEVVTWTDEAPETAQRALEMRATPKPQFVKLVNPKRVYGYLEDVLATDVSQTYRDEARYFVTGSDTSKWCVWDKETENFVVKDTSTEQSILANGMKYNELNAITDKQWKTWDREYLNIGVFLKDNPRDTIISAVESVSYKDFLPRNTSTISNTSLYILNTTAKIDLQLNGNLLTGVLSDDDLTRVQYRVSLNGQYYYPSDGSWTKLGESPQNIVLSFSSSDVKIDDWNTVKVEFRDFYGTIDYWQNQFMGTYSGLMFKDVYGQYYSSEIGEVLNYLDFGVIIAGQTTIEHEVILKNQYGYDVKDIHLYANTSKFPTGMVLEFSDSLSPFSPQPELRLKRTLTNNEEMSFFIRLKTELGTTPDANGSFDIIVRAEKA